MNEKIAIADSLSTTNSIINMINYSIEQSNNKDFRDTLVSYRTVRIEQLKTIENNRYKAFILDSNGNIIKYNNLGYFYTTTILERNTHLLHISPENVEMKHLNELKEGKDECLIRLSEEIKNAGGNGVIDLKIKYILNGLGGSSFQIIASGMGIKIRAEPLAS